MRLPKIWMALPTYGLLHKRHSTMYIMFFVLQVPGAVRTGCPLISVTGSSPMRVQHLQLEFMLRGTVLPDFFPGAKKTSALTAYC